MSRTVCCADALSASHYSGVGVIEGSLATAVTDPWTLLCGASGGCYALIGAHFAKIIMVYLLLFVSDTVER